MEKESVFKKRDGIQPAQLGDELAMLNIDSGEYFVINEVGKDIWDQINGERNIYQIIEALAKIYEVDEKTIEKDVLYFIAELRKADVINEVAYESK